jgi:hypothetical protein
MDTLKLMSEVMPLELWIVYGGLIVFGVVRLIMYIITIIHKKINE